MPFLTRDIYSNFNGLQYGKAGDQVKLVGDHVDVQIVELKTGLRFSVRSIYITDMAGEIEKGDWKPAVNHLPAKKHGKKQQTVTQQLF